MTDFQESGEDLMEIMDISVDPGQSSQRVDVYLASRIPKVSRSRIQAAILAGLIQVNNKGVKVSYKISGGDQIELKIPVVHEPTDIIPEAIPLNIVYEDETLLVVNKISGMVVHPAAGIRSGTLVNALAHHFYGPGQELMAKNRYGLVHRIDKETSGLLVVAKTEYAHAHLAKQFFDHSIEREYLALVWGEPNPPSGTIEANIGRDPRQRKRQCIFPEGLEGKHAVTHYELVETYYYTSLVKCKLETGRTHQIRVHMKYIGNPLFNDDKYGGDRILKGTIFNKYRQFVENCFEILPRLALHARSLGFIHPETKKSMYFECELPEDFKALLHKWKNYTLTRKVDPNEQE
ncbi:MAG: RluA family pseudouridine synthase [Saprospiraceae bacterium]|nr:RluA family pseudouridine synthase [Saprospiraceae bacterium]